MARRRLLTGDERRRLFDPPVQETAIIGHYTLSAEDVELVGRRYGPANRLGLAAQIALMRHPGFGLQPEIGLPDVILQYLAAQLFVDPSSFSAYGQPVFRASWARKMPTCCSMKIPLESVVATEPTLRITQLEQGIQAMVSTPEAGQPALTENHEPKQANWVAAGALIGAGLASACCVVPLLLVMLGISGAWIANLTALEPYKPYVAGVTLALLGYGFWHVYFKPKPPCEDGSYCARPQSAWTTKAVLWLGLAVAILALTIDWWAPWFY